MLVARRGAERIVRALEDRPVTVNGLVGSLSVVSNLLSPRLADLVFAEMSRRVPDSAAARGEDASPPRTDAAV